MLDRLPKKPRVVTFHTHVVDDAFSDILLIGRETGVEDRARGWVDRLRKRLEVIREKTRLLPRPKVFCVEWYDPIFCSGHWVPEMVEVAGGVDSLARKGQDSRVVAWEDVLTYAPERIVCMPCGMKWEQSHKEFFRLSSRPGWRTLPAVRENHVYLTNGSAYFNGAGPRLVDGVEILAEIIHPDLLKGIADPRGFRAIATL